MSQAQTLISAVLHSSAQQEIQRCIPVAVPAAGISFCYFGKAGIPHVGIILLLCVPHICVIHVSAPALFSPHIR